MSELERLKDRVTRSLLGDAWHGPSIQELLRDISAEQAASHPIEGAHSIWEIVHHITCWHRVVQRRLRGEAFDPSDHENWKPVYASE